MQLHSSNVKGSMGKTLLRRGSCVLKRNTVTSRTVLSDCAARACHGRFLQGEHLLSAGLLRPGSPGSRGSVPVAVPEMLVEKVNGPTAGAWALAAAELLLEPSCLVCSATAPSSWKCFAPQKPPPRKAPGAAASREEVSPLSPPIRHSLSPARDPQRRGSASLPNGSQGTDPHWEHWWCAGGSRGSWSVPGGVLLQMGCPQGGPTLAAPPALA